MNHRLTTALFADPPGAYRPIPFWFWNGDMEEAEIDRQLQEMQAKGVNEAFIHARRGLTIPYLSELWFARIGFTLKKASEYGMRMWLYDEDNWPSGYAGGRVLKADPDCRSKNLARVVVPADADLTIPEGKLVAALAVMEDGRTLDVTESFGTAGVSPASGSGVAGETPALPSGVKEITFFMERYGHWQPAYTDDWYVDLINPKCVSEFIRTTHDEYYRRFGKYFGNTVAGIFTDEPGFYQTLWDRDPDTNIWTGEFLTEFQEIKGYDLKPHLAALWDATADYRRVRADYYDVVSILFRDVFFKPIYEWCEARGVESIGHVTIEEDLKYHPRMFGGFFRSMEFLHVPGVDEIGQLRKNPDEITPKLGSSAAHMFGRHRCMSETFGVYGWKLTIEEMKATTDLQYVRGINFFVPHAFYYSIEGERKEECPPSEFCQNVWWKYFKHYADYVGRLSYMNTLGNHVADVAVYYPLPSVWAEITPTDTTIPDVMDARLKEVSALLLANQHDFDYVNDDAIRTAVYGGGQFHINEEGFSVLVIPAAIVMAVDTAERLAEYVRLGGTVIVWGNIPRYAVINGTDKQLSKVMFNLATNPGKGCLYQVMNAAEVITVLDSLANRDVELDTAQPDVNYLHRRSGSADIYFLTNRSAKERSFTATFRCGNAPRIWDPETAQVQEVIHFNQADGCTSMPVKLPGFGSTYIVFTPADDHPHVQDANLPKITSCTDKAVRGVVDSAGEYYAVAVCDSEPVRRTGTVASIPEPVTLADGWTFRLESEEKPVAVKLGVSWTEQGLPDYSGSAVYSAEFVLSAEYVGRPVTLDLGEVRETAEVIVNGIAAGTRLWRPYTLEVGKLLREGPNTLEIIITNTLANRFTEEKLPSGLLGPVTLVPHAEIVLE